MTERWVVIDEAKNFVGSRLDIVITGALQTPTGRNGVWKTDK